MKQRNATLDDYIRLYFEAGYGLGGTGPQRRRWFCDKISTHVPKGSMIADIGCGRGLLLRQLSSLGYYVFGVEANESMAQFSEGLFLVLCQQLPQLNSIPSKSVEAVVCNDVLEHLEEHDAVASIAELSRIAKTHVLISVGLHSCHVYDKKTGHGPIELHVTVRSVNWWREHIAQHLSVIDEDNSTTSAFFYCRHKEG